MIQALNFMARARPRIWTLITPHRPGAMKHEIPMTDNRTSICNRGKKWLEFNPVRFKITWLTRPRTFGLGKSRENLVKIS